MAGGVGGLIQGKENYGGITYWEGGSLQLDRPSGMKGERVRTSINAPFIFCVRYYTTTLSVVFFFFVLRWKILFGSVQGSRYRFSSPSLKTEFFFLKFTQVVFLFFTLLFIFMRIMNNTFFLKSYLPVSHGEFLY